MHPGVRKFIQTLALQISPGIRDHPGITGTATLRPVLATASPVLATDLPRHFGRYPDKCPAVHHSTLSTKPGLHYFDAAERRFLTGGVSASAYGAESISPAGPLSSNTAPCPLAAS